MPTADLRSKIRGCVLGAALGDAIGGPFEFGPLERVPLLTGDAWIDGLYPYVAATGPHGVWPLPTGQPPDRGAPPPAGTGTDDTRYNWLFLELAAELGRMPGGHHLATRYLEIYANPEIVFPGHRERTRLQFEHWEGACRGYLNQTSDLYPGLSPDLLLARGLGLNFPVLSGLITLTSAGLLYPGEPVAAYRDAFRADFYDIGYAREAVALLAASLSIALAEDIEPDALFDRVVGLDPLGLGGPFSPPFVIAHLPELRPIVADPASDREAAQVLSRAFRTYHAFDPLRTFGVALLAVLAAKGDPLRSILIAVNHVGLDEAGQRTRYEDIDCYGCIAGAIAGALAGAEAFPEGILEQVTASNERVYGMDLDATIEGFLGRFY
jgi:ADP-ribosylglycohydrolase